MKSFFIDRIEGDTAILTCGKRDWNIPVVLLPQGASGGQWLKRTGAQAFVIDPEKSKAAHETNEKLMEELSGRDL